MAGEFGEGKAPESENETSRDELYNKFQEQSGVPPVEEKQEEAKKEEVAEQPPTEVERAEKPEAEKPEQEVKEPEAKQPSKDQKTVPYGALHEERKLRQESDKAKKAAEQRAKDLEAEIARIKSQETDVITDYDTEILELKRFRQAQETLERQRQEREQREAQQHARDSFDKVMVDIDRELKDEGYGGFKYVKAEVANEIARLIDEDESNNVLDNKEGWKKVYREKFFSEVDSDLAESRQKREKATKEDLKRQANIHTPPGSKLPAKPKSADDMSDEERQQEYLRLRRGE